MWAPVSRAPASASQFDGETYPLRKIASKCSRNTTGRTAGLSCRSGWLHFPRKQLPRTVLRVPPSNSTSHASVVARPASVIPPSVPGS